MLGFAVIRSSKPQLRGEHFPKKTNHRVMWQIDGGWSGLLQQIWSTRFSAMEREPRFLVGDVDKSFTGRGLIRIRWRFR
jgi:hypothetical protein